MNTIIINDVEYAPVSELKTEMAEQFDDMQYCMVRTYSAGVFAGYIESREGKEVVLRKARRIWYWEGAASLSQLAVDGTTKPDKCKFPTEVDKVILTEVVEIIPITAKAQQSISEVPVWEA